MLYDLRPLQGAGPLELGMSRQRVLEILDHAPRSNAPGVAPPLVPDVFHDGSLLVHYTGEQPSRVVYLQFAAGGALDVRLFDQPVFATPADELIAFLAERSDYDRDDPELGQEYAFLDWELTLSRSVFRNSDRHSPDDEDDDASDQNLDPDAGRFFERIGIGVRGYVSGDDV